MAAEEKSQEPALNSIKWRKTKIFFGVVMPLLALGTELGLHFCGSIFFDPIPTWLHTALVFLVPIANYLALRKSLRSEKLRLALPFALGAAAGISAVYALLFLPILPLVMLRGFLAFLTPLGILVLMPFAPLTSLVVNFSTARRSFAQIGPRYQGRYLASALIGIFAVLIAEAPRTVSVIALKSIDSNRTAAEPVRLVRRVGDLDYLLALSRRQPISDFYSWADAAVDSGWGWKLFDRFDQSGRMPDPVLARELYYRASGEDPNARPQKIRSSFFGRFDASQAEQEVGALNDSLFLRSVTLDASADGGSGISYGEQIFTFENQGGRNAEVRFELQLPPTGVVSRATLWVDGNEREASFSKKDAAQRAYRQIVGTQRDPLLVTYLRPGVVLIQAFPAQPNKELKVRIGVTANLLPISRKQGLYYLPQIIRQNFVAAPGLKQSSWIESKSSISSTLAELSNASANGVSGLKGEIPAEQGRMLPPISVELGRCGDSSVAAEIEGEHVVQRLTQLPPLAGRRLVLVIDASKALAPFKELIIAAIKEIPNDVQLGAVIAGDELAEVPAASASQSIVRVEELLDDKSFAGGADNTRAILRALEGDRAGDSLIVWIHGAEPIASSAQSRFTQYLSRRDVRGRIFSLKASPGSIVNTELAQAAEDYRISGLEDLKRALSQISGRTERLQFSFSREQSLEQGGELIGPLHLGKLWAAYQVSALLNSKKSADKEEAGILAQRFQIVSPVSSAIVLERDEQYKQFDLNEPGANVPVIPEPETIALVAVGLLLLAHAAASQKRIQEEVER